MVAQRQTIQKAPLEGTKTGKAKEVDERLKLLRPGPGLMALLLQLSQKTWGLAGLHRDSWHHDSPGTWCHFDLEAWARDLHLHKANLIRLRTQAVKLRLIWYSSDPTHQGRGQIGWNLNFDEWPTSLRQHQWGGAGRGQGRKRQERHHVDTGEPSGRNQPDTAQTIARNQPDNACSSALNQSPRHYHVDSFDIQGNQLDYGLRWSVIKLIAWDECDGTPVVRLQEAASTLKKGDVKEKDYEKEEDVAAQGAALLPESDADLSHPAGRVVAATTQLAATPHTSSTVTTKSSADIRKRSQTLPPTAELQTYQPALMAPLSLVPTTEEAAPSKPARSCRRSTASKARKIPPQNALCPVWLRHVPEEEQPASADERASLYTGLAKLAHPEQTEGKPVTPDELAELMYQVRSWRDRDTGAQYTPTPFVIATYLGRIRGQIAKNPAPQVRAWWALRDQEQAVAEASAPPETPGDDEDTPPVATAAPEPEDPYEAAQREAREEAARYANLPIDPQARQIWQDALERIRPKISASAFTTWFDGTKGLVFEGETLVVRVGSSFNRQHLEQRFSDLIWSAVSEQRGTRTETRLIVLPDTQEEV